MSLNGWYRQVFLAHGPQRHALMLPPGSPIKYSDRPGPITEAMIDLMLSGVASYAVPFAQSGLACCLVIDIDDGGAAAIMASLRALQSRGVWAFGELHQRAGMPPHKQHGYVYASFDELTSAERIQQLAVAVIADAHAQNQLWKLDPRCTNADTRLPLQLHTHTNAFGLLILPNGRTLSRSEQLATIVDLRHEWRSNAIAQLPQAPAPTVPVAAGRTPVAQSSASIIAEFNRRNAIEDLLIRYGARRVTRTLYFCPFHDDTHASLQLWQRHGQWFAHCMSQHSNCPLATYGTNNAFNVFCLGEQLTPRAAVSMLLSAQSAEARV